MRINLQDLWYIYKSLGSGESGMCVGMGMKGFLYYLSLEKYDKISVVKSSAWIYKCQLFLYFSLQTSLKDRKEKNKCRNYRAYWPDDSRKAIRNLPRELADGAKTQTQKNEVNPQNLAHWPCISITVTSSQELQPKPRETYWPTTGGHSH